MLVNHDSLSPMVLFDALARRVRKSCAFGSAPLAPTPFSWSNMGSQARSPSTAAVKGSWRGECRLCGLPATTARNQFLDALEPIESTQFLVLLTAVAASGVSTTSASRNHKVRHSCLIENKPACPDLAERDARKSTDFNAAAIVSDWGAVNFMQ